MNCATTRRVGEPIGAVVDRSICKKAHSGVDARTTPPHAMDCGLSPLPFGMTGVLSVAGRSPVWLFRCPSAVPLTQRPCALTAFVPRREGGEKRTSLQQRHSGTPNRPRWAQQMSRCLRGGLADHTADLCVRPTSAYTRRGSRQPLGAKKAANSQRAGPSAGGWGLSESVRESRRRLGQTRSEEEFTAETRRSPRLRRCRIDGELLDSREWSSRAERASANQFTICLNNSASSASLR